MRDPRLTKLEGDLEKIQGVTGVRIVGEEAPAEIHIVATPARNAKQIVRDVQSLATTNLGQPIDHRIVSVVQLEEERAAAAAAQPAPSAPQEVVAKNGEAERPARIALDQVITASKAAEGWVRIFLRTIEGKTVEGAAITGRHRDDRARGAVAALLRALSSTLGQLNARVEVEQILVQSDIAKPSVQVRAVFDSQGSRTPLVGSALIEDDVASAAARALLQALNRKLS